MSCQAGNISCTEFAKGSVWKVYGKFSDEQTENSWVPNEKCEAEIAVK